MKKIISLLLCITMITSLGITSLADTKESIATPLDQNNENKETYEMYGEEYEIYTNVLDDGSIEKTVINPDQTIETYLLKENVLYDESGNKIATFNEESEVVNSKNDSENDPITIQGYIESDTSPYPVSDYTINASYTEGNVVLHTSILAISTGALVIIIGFIAPPVGAVMSAMLIAAGVARGIDEYAIFYKKWEKHHKIYRSLEKMWEVQWYWDPNFNEKAGTLKRYYHHFT